jgi:hypothetical protein
VLLWPTGELKEEEGRKKEKKKKTHLPLPKNFLSHTPNTSKLEKKNNLTRPSSAASPSHLLAFIIIFFFLISPLSLRRDFPTHFETTGTDWRPAIPPTAIQTALFCA